MGNKSTFIILFFIFGIFFQVQDAFASCPMKAGGCWSTQIYKEKKQCVYSPTFCDQSAECKRNGGTWDGRQCQNKNKPKVAATPKLEAIKGPQTTGVILPTAKLEITAPPITNPRIPASTTEKTCSAKSRDEEHLIDKNDANKGKEHHCVCLYASNWGGSPGEYVRDTTSEADAAGKCPQNPPTEQVATDEPMNEQVYACIQSVKEEVNNCKTQSSETMKTCDIKSEKNEKIRTPVGTVVGQATSMMHAGAVNKGALEQCKTAGLLSAAAGYGLGQIQTNCDSELKSCQSSCGEAKNYTTEAIVDKCKEQNNGVLPVGVDPAVLERQAQKLAAVAEGVDKECFQEGSEMSPTAKSLLNSAMSGVSQYVAASNSAAQCEQMISAQPQMVPLTNSCATNPGAAGCPVNCATNPSNAQCACITNPNAVGCAAGAGSQMAGNPNGASQNLPSLMAGGGLGLKPSAGAGGGGNGLNLDDLNMGDASEVNPLDQKPTDAAKTSMFGQAGAPSAGGLGGTGSGEDGKAKNGKGEAAEEEHSLFGGMFQNLKNAAGSLFNSGSGGGSSAAKKSSTVNNGANSAGLKPVVGNKALRGIASNGKSCFVDAKGTEFCFGKKNMDIFKMMNAQYSNQYNTLIIDK